MELPRRHGNHLGRNPPAEAEPDQRCAVGAEIGKQPLIGDGDIAHAAQPLRPLGSAVAWMVRNDHLEAAGQRVIKVELLRGTGVVVQDNHRTPAAGSREMQLHLAQFDKRLAPACPPRHHLSSRYPGHSNLALRSHPRQPTVCSLQGCKLVSIRDDQYILSKVLRWWFFRPFAPSVLPDDVAEWFARCARRADRLHAAKMRSVALWEV